MKESFLIFQMFLAVSLIFAQESNLKPSDYDQFYPQYFFAIEKAAEGKFKEALPSFEKMLKQYPNHQEAFFLRMICLDAIDKKISVNAAEYFFEAMNARYNTDQMNEIIFFFNKAFDDQDSYFPFYIIRGNYFSGINKYEWALSDLSIAIQLQPQSAIGYYNRGKLYLNSQMNMQAFSDFNRTIEINPEYTNVYIKRAFLYSKINEHGRVLNDFKKAYSLDSTSIKSLENSSLLNNTATIYMEQDKWETALEALNLSIKADNRWYEPFLNRGIVYKSINNYEKALTDLNKAIEIKTDIGKAYYNRGLLYKEKEGYKKAKNDLIYALQFDDTESHVYFVLAEVCTELKEYNPATRYYKIALKQEPENIWTYYQLASLYDKRRGFKEAVKYYDEFVKRASNEFYKHKIKAHDRSEKIKKYLKQKKK